MNDIIENIADEDLKFIVDVCKNNPVKCIRGKIKDEIKLLLSENDVITIVNIIHGSNNIYHICSKIKKDYTEIYDKIKALAEKQLNEFIFNHFMESERNYEDN